MTAGAKKRLAGFVFVLGLLGVPALTYVQREPTPRASPADEVAPLQAAVQEATRAASDHRRMLEAARAQGMAPADLEARAKVVARWEKLARDGRKRIEAALAERREREIADAERRAGVP